MSDLSPTYLKMHWEMIRIHRDAPRSLGQQQRINFARVLLRTDTQVALIDEGTSACVLVNLGEVGWDVWVSRMQVVEEICAMFCAPKAY